MVKIEILKNGTPIKTFVCSKAEQQKQFERAHGIAGGMWNGVDEFKITVNEA